LARLNKTQFAILGLLAIRPRSGYDIKQACDHALRHFWAESYGSIYPILRRLEAAGFAQRTVSAQVGKPDRHQYAITATGQAALRDWLAEPVELPSMRNEMLLKLFLGPRGEPAALLANLARVRADHEAKLLEYRVLEREVRELYGQSEFFEYWQLSLDYGRRMARSTIEWCERASETLQARDRGANHVNP
jgi:PadR family transcriptional regulator, regulatory protein AphA